MSGRDTGPSYQGAGDSCKKKRELGGHFKYPSQHIGNYHYRQNNLG